MAQTTSRKLWRIAKHTARFDAGDLSGGGAKMTGGRWNSKGIAAVYASTSIALATLETLAHLGPRVTIRNAFLVQISVPALVWNNREVIEAADLPPTWLSEPPGLTTIDFGSQWLTTHTAALLMVPSVIVPEEFNALINPAHPDCRRLEPSVLRQFVYDPRL